MAIFNIDTLQTATINPAAGDSVVVTQNGALSVDTSVLGADAIDISSAEDVRILNQGLISGTINVNSAGVAITNTGTISDSNDLFGTIDISAGDGPANATIHNSGGIYSMGDNDTAISIQSGGNVIQNSGEIIGFETLAIFIGGTGNDSLPGSAENLIVNTGLISAGFTPDEPDGLLETRPAISTGNDADTLINKGKIVGNVFLGLNDDVFDGRGGTVDGVVHGSLGDDLYIIDDSAIELAEGADQGTDTVQTTVSYALEANFEVLELLGAGDIDGTGNNQQNELIGNEGNNRLSGGGSIDLIDGRGGDDVIDAGRGNDIVEGGEGNDTIMGRSGIDQLNGGEGDDFLFGGLGADIMNGGDGDDTLKGGLGSDTMDGGAGADTFVFTRVADSIGGFSDVIENFEVGVDVLDFTGLVSGDMDVNILGGLTGGGQASLRTFENSFGDTVVFVDADGDGSSDMRIEVNLVTGLTESDFAV